MKEEKRAYRELFMELLGYEQRGVHIMMDGKPASPLQIVSACMAQEESSYMRDYDMSEKGFLQTLNFCHI